MSRFGSRPAWLILGIETSGRYIVIASNDMTEAEVEHIYEEEHPMFGSPWPPRLRHVEIRGRVKTYVTVEGDSYADAVAKLFDMGGPDRWSEQLALPSPQPELAEETP